MRLKPLFLSLLLPLAAVFGGTTDDALKSQLEVADGSPARSAPNAYRILFIGDSITRHGVNDWTRQNLGWDHLAGMAASSADKDYVHLLAARIQGTMPGRKVEIYYDSQVTHAVKTDGFKAGSFADKFTRLRTLGGFQPHLVVIQLGEHEEPRRGEAFLRGYYEKLVTAFDGMHPRPLVISTGVWLPGDVAKGRDDYAAGWGATVENAMRDICRRHGVPFASVRDYALDPTCHGSGASAGVRWHPNDKAMAGYAQALFAAFSSAAPPPQLILNGSGSR